MWGLLAPYHQEHMEGKQSTYIQETNTHLLLNFWPISKCFLWEERRVHKQTTKPRSKVWGMSEYECILG